MLCRIMKGYKRMELKGEKLGFLRAFACLLGGGILYW